jgi:hypothetical protein
MRTIDEAIEPFADQACNVHMLVYFVDLILLTVFPELGVGGVGMEAGGGGGGGSGGSGAYGHGSLSRRGP